MQVYAPLTRCRALGTVPQPAAVEYYSQRAFKGAFLLTEGTVISPHGHGVRPLLAPLQAHTAAIEGRAAVSFIMMCTAVITTAAEK